MRENLEAEFIGFQKPGGYAEKRIIMVKEKHACSGTRHLLFLLLLLTAIMVPILCSGCSQEVTEPELDVSVMFDRAHLALSTIESA